MIPPSMDDIVIDGRWLEPPEPMERVLPALDLMRPGQRLRFLIHREPFPLYVILEQRMLRYTARSLPDGCYEVIVTHGVSTG